MTICKVCGGNDFEMPCAYPSEGKDGCLRDARVLVESTVYEERLPHNNRKFGNLYIGKVRDLVEKRAERCKFAIDPMRSPNTEPAYFVDGWWHVKVVWYSPD